MALRTILFMLAAGGSNAFTFIAPRWPIQQASEGTLTIQPAVPAMKPSGVLAKPDAASSSGGSSSSSNSVLAFVLAATGALCLVRATVRNSVTARHASQKDRRFLGWYGNMKQRGDMQAGNPRFRYWMKLRRRTLWHETRRIRFFPQQRILRDAGLTFANEGWHKWHPDRHMHNMYKGPESHPNNPYFPAASPGYGKVSGVDALGSAKTDVTAASSVPSGSSGAGGAFAGSAQARPAPGAATASSRKRAVCGCIRAASLVMYAHKKAAASTKNQGHKNSTKHWGILKKGSQAARVKSGQTLVRQKGNEKYAGQGVVRGHNHFLKATRAGIVQWRGTRKHRECIVVPWEYVQDRCKQLHHDNMMELVPQKYEPWMAEHKEGTAKGDYMHKLRQEWLESEEGKAWRTQKDEKKEKRNKFDEVRLKAKAARYETIRSGNRLKKKVEEAVSTGGD